jgi:hypothetical protein
MREKPLGHVMNWTWDYSGVELEKYSSINEFEKRFSKIPLEVNP